MHLNLGTQLSGAKTSANLNHQDDVFVADRGDITSLILAERITVLGLGDVLPEIRSAYACAKHVGLGPDGVL